ncbi:MAG: LptF/LptG family permease [Muribaculaceae bacterium]|nr:LptF/LptG family permease [Muribaculaceae bacterium]
MLRVKRLYTFMLQTFLPLFLMTFLICLFIVLMQFLWKYIDDMVGKGLTFGVIGELFLYASLTMVPLALPLAILLASLMTFGNLGEHFELTALKASGVSLLKTMRPLIITMVLIAIGAFFFQNDVLPLAQTKMWTLLYSMRQKSPELEIPEGAFYDQIPNYNLFVEKKDSETGMLYSMMIYDVSKGFENARIILADSGKMSVTEDKTHLFLRLWDGEQFENLREQSAGGRSKNVPYRREMFTVKEILVPFDANFNRMDESVMGNQYIGKNMQELLHTVDSVRYKIDSVGTNYSSQIRKQLVQEGKAAPTTVEAIILDSVFAGSSPSNAKTILNQALAKAKRQKQEYEFKSFTMEDDRKVIRIHQIELMKKFTLSFACIVFFFIGAPLGAIIRKGGLGTPIVISVLLFIVYYIFDNSGYKLARDGRWPIWAGMWLSSMVLLPLGIFFTYKAVNDSAVFNSDAYKLFFKRLTGKLEREIQLKEFPMSEVLPLEARSLINAFNNSIESVMAQYENANPARRIWLKIMTIGGIESLEREMGHVLNYLSDTRDNRVIYYLNQYPFLINYKKGLLSKLKETNNKLLALFEEGDNMNK